MRRALGPEGPEATFAGLINRNSGVIPLVTTHSSLITAFLTATGTLPATFSPAPSHRQSPHPAQSQNYEIPAHEKTARTPRCKLPPKPNCSTPLAARASTKYAAHRATTEIPQSPPAPPPAAPGQPRRAPPACRRP